MRKKYSRMNGGISKKMDQILPSVLNGIDKRYHQKPSRIIEAWPMIIGEKLASFTEVVSLEKGTLNIKVKSSTLLSLLVREEKARLLKELQSKFSKDAVRNINFRIG